MRRVTVAAERAASRPLACVLGEMSLVRPLGLADVASAVVAPASSPAHHSRFTRVRLPWETFNREHEALTSMLLNFARTQPEPPVLFYDDDFTLEFVSGQRTALAGHFRFLLPDSALVQDLVDKSRFAAMAQRLDLPVPPSRLIRPTAMTGPTDIDLRPPFVLKPITRRPPWPEIGGHSKALVINDVEALGRLWPRLAATDMALIAQELIPGPETAIESYHVYIDAGRRIVAEFTGRKIRTYPVECGHSSALEIAAASDVLSLGRAVVEKLALVGVAKLDFKRDPAGRLHLLEVNPRFNLWHALGAAAGVNLPALVYADLAGLPRPAPATARPRTRWCNPRTDFAAARALGISPVAWLAWMLRCEVISNAAWDDPLPLLYAIREMLVARAPQGSLDRRRPSGPNLGAP